MSYKSCSDPCCYAAHISPEDLSWNSSAIPCRRHRSPICQNPFRSALTFGIITPWIFILSVVFVLFITLCYDWRHQKKCFKHVETIRSTRQRLSKSEPKSPPPSRPVSPKPVQKVKPPPPPPPLVPPYLPPLRSQSQPPPIVRLSSLENSRIPNQSPIVRLSSLESSRIPNNFRPPDPPPPIPQSPPPPKVPYHTRPNISDVAYLKKKFEDQ